MEKYLVRISFVVLLCSSGRASSIAQEMIIRSIALQPMNKEAMEFPCFDNNGDTCALLKIKTDFLEGLEFPNRNQYIKFTYSAGVYNVYVPALSRKLDLLHKDYTPVQIDLSDYGYKRLRKGKTYQIVLDAEKRKDLKSMAVLKIVPHTASLIFDNIEIPPSENGTYDVPVSEGRHTFTVIAENYTTHNGTVIVGKSEVKTIPVRLQPITHEIVVGCNVDNARVYVDNQDYGHIGRLYLPQGQHNIRVQANGYVDSEQIVNINTTTRLLSFTLAKNKRTKHIHPTPVTIIAPNSKNVYKDNKKILEWVNGATIMFMPGKYTISDDNGNKQKIEVGTEPREVYL